MDCIKVINSIKGAAVSLMQEKGILASVTIASSLYHLMNDIKGDDWEILLNAKNVMAIKAKNGFNEDTVILNNERGIRYKSYDNFRACMVEWVYTLKMSNIRNVWDVNKVIPVIYKRAEDQSLIESYIKAYRLKDIDKSVLGDLYPSNPTIVEAPKSDITEQIQKDTGYTDKTEKVDKTPKKPNKKKEPIKFVKGAKFTVKNINIYNEPGDGIASRSFTGNLWIHNIIRINNRYPVVFVKENVTKSKKYINGYVKITDLARSVNM